jgi:hypothetical protein
MKDKGHTAHIAKKTILQDVVEAYNVEDLRRCETEMTKTEYQSLHPHGEGTILP